MLMITDVIPETLRLRTAAVMMKRTGFSRADIITTLLAIEQDLPERRAMHYSTQLMREWKEHDLISYQGQECGWRFNGVRT